MAGFVTTTKNTCRAVLFLLTAASAVAQSPPPSKPVAQASSPVVSVNVPSVEQRLAVLEERLNTTLALKEEKIQDIKDRIETIYKLAAFLVAVLTVIFVVFSIRDTFLRSRERERQRSIDEVVKEMMTLQNKALGQQVSIGAMQVKAAESKPDQFGPVQNVSGVIEAVQKTLAFRLEQEQEVANAIKEIKEIKTERERTRKLKVDSALAIQDQFKKMSRLQFTTLTPEQHKRAVKLVELVADLRDTLKEQPFGVAGNLLYTCGVISYYDDIIESRLLLDQAAEVRAADHEAELKTNEDYRIRFAFIHYFRSLIHKNWGQLADALYEIDQSAKLLEDRQGEFLSPVTKAEILSYGVGDEPRCRSEVNKLLTRLHEVEVSLTSQGKGLDANQLRLRNRMLLLLGNTYFVLGDFAGALDRYSKAVVNNPADYYALASVAQCQQAQGDSAATGSFNRCLNAIERSGDFGRKRERSTRAVIAVIAATAARGCDDQVRYEKYVNEARDMLSGNLDVDGMSPNFFSPATKRLVGARELLSQVEQGVAATATTSSN
jgi:tetratricopeptide (TPR) repeat protein